MYKLYKSNSPIHELNKNEEHVYVFLSYFPSFTEASSLKTSTQDVCPPLPQMQLENHGDVHIYVLVGFRKPQQQRKKHLFGKILLLNMQNMLVCFSDDFCWFVSEMFLCFLMILLSDSCGSKSPKNDMQWGIHSPPTDSRSCLKKVMRFCLCLIRNRPP